MTLDEFIAEKSRKGWQIISRDPGAVQMKRGKRLDVAGLIIGAVLVIAYGVGLIILILVALDYATQKERIAYVTAAQLAADDIPRDWRETQTAWDAVLWALVIIPGAVIAIGWLAYWLITSFT